MNISIHQSTFTAALARVGRAIKHNATLPVLANVLLATNGARLLEVAGCNLKITILTTIDCTVVEPGAITVPYRLLADIIGTLPADQVDLTANLKTQVLTVRCGASKTDIKGIDAQEFPPVKLAVGEPHVIKGAELREAIRRVEFAASRDEARPVLQGVYIANKTMAATDGFRLAWGFADLPDMLVARIGEVARLATSETVGVYRLAGSVLWRCGNTDITTPMIDGRFVDYQQIVPKSFRTTATVDAPALLGELKRAGMFGDVVTVEVGEQKIHITSSSDETGEYKGEIAAETENAVTFHANVRFLIEAIEAAGPRVTLAANDGKSPVMVTGEGEWKSVIMPMHKG